MRLASHIFGLAFIFIFGMMHVQLVIPEADVKKEKVCAKSGCGKQPPADDKKDCRAMACNPFVPCSTGPCCYLVENFFTYSMSAIVPKKRFLLEDDHRVLSSLSECWHPPEGSS